MTTLRELVEREMENHSDTESDIETIIIGQNVSRRGPEKRVADSLAELEEYEGNIGFGAENLPGVRMWTENRVYFKTEYDGAEGIWSVPRDPTEDASTRSI